MIYYKDLLTIGIHAYNEGKYISRKEMRDEQINILKKAGFKSIGFFEKLFLISKSKKKLKKRFGSN
jgi:hypothetical protein